MLDNVAVGGYNRASGKKEAYQRAEKSLQTVGLSNKAESLAMLLNTGEQSLNARNKDICSFCTETVNALPPDKNLYLLQAETYRALKKKDEALEAYRRAFEAYKRTLELC